MPLPSYPPVISLQCPISMKRQLIPVRTLSCTHVQTFDLSSAILTLSDHQFRKNVLVRALSRAQAEFCCPICCKTAPLYVDEILSKALSSFSPEDIYVTINGSGEVCAVKSMDGLRECLLDIENSLEKQPCGYKSIKPNSLTEVFAAFTSMHNNAIVSSPQTPSIAFDANGPSSTVNPPRRRFSFRNLSGPVTSVIRKRSERSRSPNYLRPSVSSQVTGLTSGIQRGQSKSPTWSPGPKRFSYRDTASSLAAMLPPTPLPTSLFPSVPATPLATPLVTPQATNIFNFHLRSPLLKLGGPRYRRLSTIDLTDSPC